MRKIFGFLFLIGFITAGCGRQGTEVISPPALPSEKPSDASATPMESLLNEVSELMGSGKHAAAIALVEEAIQDEKYAEDQSRLVGVLSSLYVRFDPAVRTRDLILTYTNETTGLSLDAVSNLGNYLLAYKRYDEALMASEQFRSMTDDDAIQRMAWQWVCRVAVGQNKLESIAASLDQMAAELPELEVAGLLGQSINMGIRNGSLEGVDALITAVEGSHANRPGMKAVLTLGRADLFSEKGDNAASANLLLANANMFQDRQIRGRLQRAGSRYLKQGKHAELDALAQQVVDKLSQMSSTRSAIASLWVDSAIRQKLPVAAMDRLDRMRAAGMTAEQQRRVYENVFYEVMNGAPLELQKRCLGFGQGIPLDQLRDDGQSLLLALLDGTFFLSDFDSSLKLLTEGIPGQDKDWHEMLINKVGAHKAEVEGRFEEAIAGYQRHMDRVNTWEDSINDPITQQAVIKEAVLAFNEKRVGDLYGKMGRLLKPPSTTRKPESCTHPCWPIWTPRMRVRRVSTRS